MGGSSVASYLKEHSRSSVTLYVILLQGLSSVATHTTTNHARHTPSTQSFQLFVRVEGPTRSPFPVFAPATACHHDFCTSFFASRFSLAKITTTTKQQKTIATNKSQCQFLLNDRSQPSRAGDGTASERTPRNIDAVHADTKQFFHCHFSLMCSGDDSMSE